MLYGTFKHFCFIIIFIQPPLRHLIQPMVPEAQETLLLQLLPVHLQEGQEGHRAPGDGGVEEDQEGGGVWGL